MQRCDAIIEEIRKAFVGEKNLVKQVLIALLANGHVLLEDIPGVGKTTLAVAFSQAMGLKCNRIQFTPDIMPSDVVGFTMPSEGTMEYRPGAAMCNFLLADEINRASARSQSALLEAMQEHSVTVDGVTHRLPEPFFVLATQNPTGSAGTQLLPDSQTDRFIMRLSIGYPGPEEEMDLLLRKHGDYAEEPIREMIDVSAIIAMQNQVSRVFIHEAVYKYILRLIHATRNHEAIQQGASPRCTVALAALAQAAAYVEGREYVLPGDVAAMYEDCTSHRIILTPQAERDRISSREILSQILKSTSMPRLKVS